VLTHLNLGDTFIAAFESALFQEEARAGEFFDKMMIRIESLTAQATQINLELL
jgi:hypothetical protein